MKIIDILHSPWAIRPERLVEITEIYARHLRGEKINNETIAMIEAQTGKVLDNKPKGYEVVNDVAVLPIDGVLSKKMNFFMRISGGTSTELMARDFAEIVDDPSIKAVILNIDSPGGTVDGTQELASAIFAARGIKPIMAFSNGMMASAAYWIGSAADKIYISGDTVDVGSIGVVTSHVDYSRAYEDRGIKVTELTAGKYKRIASEYAPLSESGRAYIQDQLDHIYNVFLADVGRNRGGMSADQVHEQMADGRIFIGTKSIKAGLVDGVSTLAGLVDLLAGGALPGRVKSIRNSESDIRSKKTESNAQAGGPRAESEESIMDLKELKEKYPDLYKAVSDEGRALGIEDGRKQGREEGAKDGAAAELTRVKAVKAVSLPGHEALIEGFMFDGKTTGPEAALAIVNAENAKRQAKAEAIKKDGEDLKVPPAADAEEEAKKTITRKEFDAMNQDKRAEFIKAGGKVTD